MLKTFLTSTALTVALAAPSFAETSTDDTAMDVDMEATFDAAASADTDLAIPEDMDGEAEMTVTAETMNADMEGEAEMSNETQMADAETVGEPELEQLSQFTGMTVSEIVGLDVLSADGEDVGEVDYIFVEDDEYKAVIGIGGFLGLGEHTVALPLGNFAMTDGDLILDATTEAQLDAMPEVDESELDELDGDYVIS